MIIIFDFDGVIADSDTVNKNLLKRIFGGKSVALSDEDYQKFFWGESLKKGLEQYVQNKKLNPELINAVMEEKKNSDAEYTARVTFFPDAMKLIHALRPKGVTVCLATNARKVQIQNLLNKFELRDTFPDEMLITFENNKGNKYETMLEKLGHPKDIIRVIEDSPSGIKTAHEAGLKCFVIDRGGLHKSALQEAMTESDFLFHDLEEIIPLISLEGNGKDVERKNKRDDEQKLNFRG
jgi:HAD superfamily hydrolase (TIGR01509 family)